MAAGRNRELLVETLGERYQVETTTDVETLNSEFDCCVFDLEQFNRVAGTLQPRRDTSNLVFLPFVLLVGEDAPETATTKAREYVDDVIELPVKKAALLSRIGNLVERRRTTVRLAEREAQLEQTVEDLKLKERAMDEATVGITITDPSREDNPLIYCNEQFERLTGYEDVIGENHRFLQGEGTDPLEVLNRVLSHNLRNKMNVIEGHTELLQDEYDGDRPESLDIIESTATDLVGLADTVREVDAALSGPAPAEPTDLTDRLEQLVGAVRERFPDATFRLTVPEDDPCRVVVPRFMAAIEEAVENAIKHNDTPEPVVEIRIAGQSADWISVGIEDNGPGIPEQELDVLETGETPLNHADRLGLWFIYWVVRRVGGEFTVEEAEPRGIELTLTVPRHRAD
ncbi:PAS domain-containing sensor histidine kinase [Halobacteriales archaeon QH_6_66_25]|nr:MAG: PAS domain-containing sensor histidine kinase [Halobacteriales archaeon QH_6_66_25]